MSYTINLISKNSSGVETVTDVSNNVIIGFSVVEKLDDSLDVGTIILEKLTTSTPYTMFDTIQIKVDNVEKFSLRISGDNVELVSKNPKRYRHTLTLVEHTKILELYQISAKTLTQPLTGTKKSLYDFINEIRLTTPYELNDLISTTRIFEMPTGSLETYLKSIDSPEFTFKDLTLKEALFQICGFIDGIPRLIRDDSTGNLVLTIDFVNELNDLISSFDGFISDNISQDISLYANELETEALNLVIDNDLTGATEVYPGENAHITARNDNYIYDFLTSYIPTPKKIYDVRRIRVTGHFSSIYDGTPITSMSGTDAVLEVSSDRIVEKSTYDTLQFDGATNEGFYKTNVFYFVFNQRNIVQSDTYGIFGINTTLEKTLDIAGFEYAKENGLIPSSASYSLWSFSISSDEKEVMYRVDYVPIEESLRINIEREDLVDVNRKSTILSNQESRLINYEQFTNNAFGRINRIGNSELELQHRVSVDSAETNEYSIGDYTDDGYIVTIKETIMFKDYLVIKYGLSRNYNMISKFIGVQSEIRQYEMGEKNTLKRNVVYKEYIEIEPYFVVSNPSGADNSKILTSRGREMIMSTVSSGSPFNPIRGCIIEDSTMPQDTLVPVSSNGGGNSLLLSFKLENNKTAGVFNDVNTNIIFGDQIASEGVEYTNTDGSLENLTVNFFDEFQTETLYSDRLDRANNFPKSDVTNIINNIVTNTTSNPFKLYKDPREIINKTLQFSIISKDTNKVVIGRYFSFRNKLTTETPPISLVVYTYNDGTQYGRTDTLTIKSGYDSSFVFIPSISVTDNRVILPTGDVTKVTDKSSWAVGDENGNLMFAINQDNIGQRCTGITFDFNNKRSNLNYKF